jgi:hypothetical protein
MEVFNYLTIVALIIMLASGLWMGSEQSFSIGGIHINSNWGTIGLALGGCLMIMSRKSNEK